MRPRADEPARIGDGEHGREGEREPPDIVAEQIGAGGQNGGEDKVGDEERAHAAEARIGLRDGRKRRRRVGPDRCRHQPPERVRAGKRKQGQQEDAEAETDGDEVFAEPRRRRCLDGNGCFGHFRPLNVANGLLLVDSFYRLLVKGQSD